MVVGSWLVSETILGGGEARVLVISNPVLQDAMVSVPVLATPERLNFFILK